MIRRRTLNSLWAGLLPCSLVLCIGLRVEAQGTQPSGQLPRRANQQPQPNQPQNQLEQRQRPQAEPLVVEKLSPELEQILKNWELASSRINTLQGKHRRWVYDSVFSVEKRAEGEFFYSSPDQGRIDLFAGKIQPGEVSRKLDANGKPFKLEADYPEKWICTGAEILQIDEEKKEFEVFPLPPEARGTAIMDGPLPFLFGMPAEKAKRRFKLTLINITEEDIRLSAEPRLQQDSVNYKQANIILSRKTYLPKAVQLFDPSGNLETVYLFTDLEANKQQGRLLEVFRKEKNPFHPNLKGYKLLKTPQVASPQPGDGNAQRNAQRNAERPALPRRR